MLSVIPFDRLSRDTERPFKAYPRSPITLPSSYYSTYGTTPYSTSLGLSLSTSKAPESTMAEMSSSYRSSYLPEAQNHIVDISQTMSNRGMKPEPTTAMDYMAGHGHHQMAYPSNHMHLSHHPASGMPNPMTSSPASLNHSQMALNVAQPQPPSAHQMSPQDSPPCSNILNKSQTPDSTENLSQSFKMPPKKRPQPVPVEQKDKSYWEKRKKNNDSAKRSRDQRRMKEEQIAMRVVYLEQENLQLRTEVSLLKSEIEKLRCMLYNS